ncbi:MAG: FecR domain-containing protein [Cyclobacteriaceae bacterium]
MDRKHLKQLLENNYAGMHLDELIEWIESDKFDAELLASIEHDLLEEINNGGTISAANLDHIVEEILTIANLQNEALNTNGSYTSAHSDKGSVAKLPPKRRMVWLKPALKVAASLVFILSVSFVLYEQYQDTQVPAETKVANLIVKKNPKGRKSTISLKDGSKVILNSESSIIYDENFASDTREIELNGEAFFEVAHNPEKPFVVKSGAISTVALGTSFNVCNYSDADLMVTLVSGKVRIEQEGQLPNAVDNILMPGEKIKYLRGSRTLEKLKYNDYEDLLWKDGILSFKQSSVEEVVANLERWYGVEIEVVAPSKKKVSYGAVFKDQSLKQVLQAMGFTLNFDYAIDEKNVKIMFN